MGRTPRPPRLWQRENGKWYVVYWDHEAGKRRYKSCDEESAINADLRAEMLRKYKGIELRSAVRKLDRPVGTDYDRNLIAAVNLYLADAAEREKSGSLAYGSLKKLHDTLDKFIEWLPTSLTTGALNPRHLEQFLRTQDLAANTLNTYKQNLASCLNWLGKERPKLFPEPELFSDALRKKTTQRSEIQAYTPAQLQTFLGRIPGDVHQQFLLTALTGARFGEVTGLTWDDVDLSTGYVTIHAQKTGRRRYVPLGEIAPRLLKSMRKWPKTTKPAACDHARFWWWDWSRRIGLLINPQRLRRNFTGYALACGFPPATVAQWQGHSLAVAQAWYAQQVLAPMKGKTIQDAMGL